MDSPSSGSCAVRCYQIFTCRTLEMDGPRVEVPHPSMNLVKLVKWLVVTLCYLYDY